MSRIEFEALFPDDAACAEYLARTRWPEGFTCPVCGTLKSWARDRNRPTWECAECRRLVISTTSRHVFHIPDRVRALPGHLGARNAKIYRNRGIPSEDKADHASSTVDEVVAKPSVQLIFAKASIDGVVAIPP